MNRYLPLLILVAMCSQKMDAQTLSGAPKLVVNITIDQLRNDYIEHFAPLYGDEGFRKLLTEGCVYESASYPFSPVDRSSAIASIVTGTTPYYNNIISQKWLDRSTLRPVYCVDDPQYVSSPQRMATSTVSDEMKVASNGASIVFAIAADRDAAILSAGHAADGAFWIDPHTGNWTSSPYFSQGIRKWLSNYRSANPKPTEGKEVSNDAIARMAINCATEKAMGHDDVTDYLAITLSAEGKDEQNWRTEMEKVYRGLDHTLATLIAELQKNVGKDNVLFVVTSTGYTKDQPVDYARYRIPTGTFYINRTANLLNIYLGAIYGQGQYVMTCFHNEIYLDRKLIENKRVSFEDVISRSKDFLVQISGVRGIQQSPYSPSVSGDLIIEVAPGWKLLNEDNQETFTARAAFVPFPIIFFGAGFKPQSINSPVTVDRIAPTLAKSIQIRAPNACKAAPLQ